MPAARPAGRRTHPAAVPGDGGNGSDGGAGVISTAFGVGAFLVFLFFTAQIVVNLFFISTVTTAAHDAARSVARGGHTPAEAEHAFASFVGPSGDEAILDWSGTSADEVVLEVRVPYPDLALNEVPLPFFDDLDRTVRVRVEQVQG
jgi:hypothetical protein